LGTYQINKIRADALRWARFRALADFIHLRGGWLTLTPDTYRELRGEGWTKARVDAALDDLAWARWASIDNIGALLVVRLVDGADA
jgi:hypothetical protein